ncbi:hypothetical protein OJ998_23410 [Solirubrobacter taibaiensis]|nr:hypothetical protein [Solirubrobacter taibaiensis]
MPCSAMAQAPTIAITSPGGNSPYALNATVLAAYSCSGLNVVTCEGTVANGAPINTSAVGTFPFTVSAKNADGATLTTSVVNYQVTQGGTQDPGGNVPATLNLNLGTPTAFTAFVPGVAMDYTSTLTAQILSTAGDAKLTVADASDTNVGKMVNGTYALPQTVQVGAQKVVVPPTGPNTLDPTAPAFKPLTGMSSPTELLTYGGPVSGSAIVTFKQAIAATDALRTGSYSKTLTFTLSTTNP